MNETKRPRGASVLDELFVGVCDAVCERIYDLSSGARMRLYMEESGLRDEQLFEHDFRPVPREPGPSLSNLEIGKELWREFKRRWREPAL